MPPTEKSCRRISTMCTPVYFEWPQLRVTAWDKRVPQISTADANALRSTVAAIIRTSCRGISSSANKIPCHTAENYRYTRYNSNFKLRFVTPPRVVSWVPCVASHIQPVALRCYISRLPRLFLSVYYFFVLVFWCLVPTFLGPQGGGVLASVPLCP